MVLKIMKKKTDYDLAVGKGDPITFILNSKIYSKSSIEQALSDYSTACEGEIVDGQFTIKLSLKEEIDEPLQEEFCNYVLGLMKNNL
jgi:hypothetical protein